MRKPIAAANWKMNPPPSGWDAENSPYRGSEQAEVMVFPASIDIPACVEAFLATGGQSARAEATGAFTGDVSMAMLAAHGCKAVLCGHSERRQHHHETDEMIASQVKAALDAGLTPVVCVGETLDQRELGQAEETVKQQLSLVLEAGGWRLEAVIVAYEPVWAIGTGKTATPEDAQSMHAFIRSLLPADVRDSVRLLYGGSVKPGNARELIGQEDIDGFLVGGASLIPDDFRSIVEVMRQENT